MGAVRDKGDFFSRDVEGIEEVLIAGVGVRDEMVGLCECERLPDREGRFDSGVAWPQSVAAAPAFASLRRRARWGERCRGGVGRGPGIAVRG